MVIWGRKHHRGLFIRGPKNKIEDSQTLDEINQNENIEMDISNKAYEINTLNSNEFSPKEFSSCKHYNDDNVQVKDLKIKEYDMKYEQSLDKELSSITIQLQNGKATKSVESKYILMDGILYFISKADSEPVLRLYVPLQLREEVVNQYHDVDHLGVDKTYDAIKIKYFWPNLYKELHEYVNSCIICQQRSSYNGKPLLQETDIPPFPFAKVAVDLSGPYPKSLSGNKYIISFINIYSGYPECFPVPDKSAANIVQLLMDEIIPRHSCPLTLLSDNGSENCNNMVRETLKEMKINHVTTSFYSPGSNGKVERLHRFMHDILAKKIKDGPSTWDVYLNQTLAAIRCSKNESTKFSPFYLLYNRDPVLPVDNLLKPRRKYAGESPHQILLEQQHKSFVTVHRNLKKAKTKQKEYADKNRQEINFKVGDAVYFKNHLRKSKLDSNWKPFYRIIEQRSPVSFIVKNQLTGSTTKGHAQHLKPAPVETWDIPKSNEIKKLRKSRFVVPPESSESEMEVDNEENEMVENRTSFRNRLIRKNKHERDTSSDEDVIPLMELKKRINIRNKSLNSKEVLRSETDEDDEIPLSKLKQTLKSDARDESDVTDNFSDRENMSVNSVNVNKKMAGIEVSENRHAINSFIRDLHEIDSKLENVTEEFEKQIVDLENYIQQYVQLDLITGELKLLMQKAMFYLEHLGSQLNMLSLGHLSPSTITPTNLKRLLNEIKNKLPRYLELSEDPNLNLWFFYRLLTCTTVLYDDKILAIISLPLLDSNNRFEVYKAYNLPMPMKNNSTKLLTMVAKFDINVEYFAVNAERSKYVLLNNDEINKCTNRFTKFCKIVSPVYPINLSKNCAISLFMKKENDIDKFCKVLVEPSSILPMANYISSGSCQERGGEKVMNFAAKYDKVEHLVSAKTEGEVTTNGDVASAPMLVNHKDDTQNNIYPVLKLPIIDN
ncbi:unnamed protein product [Mytilus coruscus]|uniref:Integrase catalytic domain-containing protein n=1 Tax=Mytilus coruscus TaxID=42192 RepID=A0A6J8DXG7_MYTCO|nr:unnamed protein product [Mytilus coruscus]